MIQFYTIPPQLYDDQFWWKTNDIEFWKQALFSSTATSNILEIASGTGRLAKPLIVEGAKYSGLEISQEYADFSILKLSQYIENPSIYIGDMRNFNLNQTFDYVFIGFNSLLHLLNEEDLNQFLKNVKKHMHAKSIFYIDVLIPKNDFLYRDTEKLKIMSFKDTVADCELDIYERLKYNSFTEIADILWTYYKKSKKKYSFNFQMKMFYPDTLNKALVDNGFYIESLWGDYDGSAISEKSDLQIYKCLLRD